MHTNYRLVEKLTTGQKPHKEKHQKATKQGDAKFEEKHMTRLKHGEHARTKHMTRLKHEEHARTKLHSPLVGNTTF
jgi:hypothetical protein